jgi:hypothetical protein
LWGSKPVMAIVAARRPKALLFLEQPAIAGVTVF